MSLELLMARQASTGGGEVVGTAPVVLGSVASGTTSGTTTSLSVSFPAHNAGDLLFVRFATGTGYDGTLTLPSGWTGFAGYTGGKTLRIGYMYRVATASGAAGTATLTSTNACAFRAICYRIQAGTFRDDAGTIGAAVASGSGTGTAAGAQLVPWWEDFYTLWIGGIAAPQATSITGYPYGGSGYEGDTSAASGGVTLGATATPLNAGLPAVHNFTLSASSDWAAYPIAVRGVFTSRGPEVRPLGGSSATTAVPNTTITLTALIAAGDLIVVTCATPLGPSVSFATGWTVVTDGTTGLHFAYRVADSAFKGGSSFTVSFSLSTTHETTVYFVRAGTTAGSVEYARGTGSSASPQVAGAPSAAFAGRWNAAILLANIQTSLSVLSYPLPRNQNVRALPTINCVRCNGEFQGAGARTDSITLNASSTSWHALAIYIQGPTP